MTARDRHRQGGKGRYGPSPAPMAFPLALAGLYAVHVPAGTATHVYHCEPGTGRCSCGGETGSGACAHVAAARALAAGSGSAVSALEKVA